MSDTIKIRQTLDSIAKCLDSLKYNVDSISEYIKNDSIVNPDVISNTMRELLELKNSQDILKKDYIELFPGEKCSELLNEVISNVECYEAHLEEKKLLSKAKYIIVKFNSIRSKVEECQNLLNEYSIQLKDLSDKDLKLDDYIKAVEPYEELYKIVDSASRDDKIAYSMKNTIFSCNSKLLLSLIQDNLYIDKSLLTDIEDFIETESDEPFQLSFDTLEDNNKENNLVETQASESTLDKVSSNSTDEKIEAPKTEDIKLNDNPIEVEPSSDTLAKSKAELPTDTESASENAEETDESNIIDLSEFKSFGISIKDRNLFSNTNVEDNDDGEKVTTKKFKKDIEKFNKGCGFILFVLTKHYYITEDFITKGRASDINFRPVLESLLKSGYIRKDTIGDYPAMYTISNKALNCLKDKSNADWFKKIKTDSKNVIDIENTNIMSKESESNQNIILTRVGYCVIAKFIDDFYSQGSMHTSNCLSDYYYADLREFGKHKTSFYFLSCFINNDDEASKVIENIEFHITQLTVSNIDYSILISDNTDECIALMNYLKTKHPCFSNTRFYCYSVTDMKYYDIVTKEEISHENLIQAATDFHKSKYSSANKEKEEKIKAAKSSKNISINDINKEEKLPSENIIESPVDVLENVIKTTSPIINEKAVAESLDTIADIIEEISAESNNQVEEPAIDYSMVYDTQNISEESVMSNVYSMINSGKAYCASAYLGVVSPEAKYSNLKNELSFALNTPDKKGVYLSDVVMNIFDDIESIPGAFSDCLKVCAEMRVLFYNTAHHDYSYKQMYSVMKSLEPIETNAALADLAYKLENFKSLNSMGIDAIADYRVKENIIRDKIISDISKEAASLYDSYITNPVKERSPLPRYVDMKKMIFKEKNALSECLKIVADNSSDETFVEYVRDFINSNFIDENIEIKSDNFKKQSIDDYIDYLSYR